MGSDKSASQPSLGRSPSRDFSGTDIQDTDFVLLQSSASPSYTVSDVSSNVKAFNFSDSQNAKESPNIQPQQLPQLALRLAIKPSI
jgi:hypothetical protein